MQDNVESMEIRHLRYFTAVVEAGSLTAAAARLHMSQPPLSVAISQLESELKVSLLVRSSRGVEPTTAGRYLLEASSRILADVDEVVTTLGRFGAGTAGSLTMAAVPQLMWHRVPELIREYSITAPEVGLRLVDPPPWTAIDMLADSRVDLAAIVVSDHEQFIARHRDSFTITDWGPVPVVAALPPAEVDAPDPLPLSSFDGRTVLLPRRTSAVPSVPETVETAFRAHGVVPAEIRTTETLQTSLPLIEAGVARAILPDPDRSSLSPRFDVVVRRLDPEPPPLRALVLTRPGSLDPALPRLLEHMSAETGNPDRNHI